VGAVDSRPARRAARSRVKAGFIFDANRVESVARILRLVSLWLFLAIACAAAAAAEIAAPYVPTAPSVVERMLEIAKVGPQDFVIDLGSGDGRINITAAQKRGARGLGIEIDTQLIAKAKANAQAAGVADRVDFVEADLFTADLSQATVVTIYLLKRATMKLRDRLFELRPGTRIVSHAASMGEWRADYFEMLDVKDKVRPDAPNRTYIHYWVVPAKVGGTWSWRVDTAEGEQDCELRLSQQFQALSGTLRVGGSEYEIEEGKLEGDRIVLRTREARAGTGVRYHLSGQVADASMAGTLSILGGGPERTVRFVSSLQAAAR
jgi:precorrin-6B methylase 2